MYNIDVCINATTRKWNLHHRSSSSVSNQLYMEVYGFDVRVPVDQYVNWQPVGTDFLASNDYDKLQYPLLFKDARGLVWRYNKPQAIVDSNKIVVSSAEDQFRQMIKQAAPVSWGVLDVEAAIYVQS